MVEMQSPPSLSRLGEPVAEPLYVNDDTQSAVSWPAIFGGTVCSMAVMLVFIALGSGLGLASVSFWSHDNASPKEFTYMAAAWLITIQWVSSGLGGYLTGRLRTKWNNVHTHEVFFRDTAHGLLTWAVATVCYTAFLILAASAAVGGSVHMMGAATQSGSAQTGSQMDVMISSTLDTMMRADHPVTAIDPDTKSELMRLFSKGVVDGALSDNELAYIGQTVATRTGLAEVDAEKKVIDAIAQVHDTLENARKTMASISLSTSLSMLIGAFVACVAAALGGMRRDAPVPATK
jgi:hypothetical protein